jgi:N-acetylneuraminate synthase
MENLFKLLRKRVLVIAEIGCNHNGDKQIAKRLIKAAAESGADIAKFQTFNPDELLTIDTPKALYQIKAAGTKETQFERLDRIKLNKEDHKELKNYCESSNIIFCSSPFDHQSVDLLHELDVPFFKVASGEITNLPLLEHISSYGKPIVLSTGMSNLGEIEDALNAIGEKCRKQVVLMHCISTYPANWEDANLRAIRSLREAFNLPVGFSDHSTGIELSLVAVGMGAVIIEKHITVSKEMDGGDHIASLDMDEFRDLVSKIRRIEGALGDGIKRCIHSEENVKEVARKSIVSRRTVDIGKIITSDDLVIKRPGVGIPPKYLSMIIGAKAKESISADKLIKWSQLDLQNK